MVKGSLDSILFTPFSELLVRETNEQTKPELFIGEGAWKCTTARRHLPLIPSQEQRNRNELVQWMRFTPYFIQREISPTESLTSKLSDELFPLSVLACLPWSNDKFTVQRQM